MTEKDNSQINQFETVDRGSPAILLVDDNEINLQTLYQTLDGKGYSLLIARSGEDALRLIPSLRVVRPHGSAGVQQ